MSHYLELIQRSIPSESKPKVLEMTETVDGWITPAFTSAGFTKESNSFEGMNTYTSRFVNKYYDF